MFAQQFMRLIHHNQNKRYAKQCSPGSKTDWLEIEILRVKVAMRLISSGLAVCS